MLLSSVSKFTFTMDSTMKRSMVALGTNSFGVEVKDEYVDLRVSNSLIDQSHSEKTAPLPYQLGCCIVPPPSTVKALQSPVLRPDSLAALQ